MTELRARFDSQGRKPIDDAIRVARTDDDSEARAYARMCEALRARRSK